jgi:hypothetical protein
MLAHQHLRSPWLAGRDRLVDTVMIAVAVADIAMLKRHESRH